MEKNGFTLVELLVCFALLGFVLLLGITVNRNALVTSLVQIRNVSDNEVFEAARNYANSGTVSLKKGYTCVYVKDLIDYGYLNATNDNEIREKLVKVSINNTTKVINNIRYVDNCE